MGDSDPDPDPDPGSSPEIAAIRSIAVDAEAVADAFVYGRENPGIAVLRVTPPFHGRMRARIHVFRDDPGPEAAYCRPEDLLPAEVVEAYPVGSGGDSEPGDADESVPRNAHAGAIEDWRGRAERAIVDEATVERGDDRVRVEVRVLG